MEAPTVVNIQKGQEYDLYIGRLFRWKGRWMRSKWGNLFKIGRDGTREEVIEKYRAWLYSKPELLAAWRELSGQRLGCWCAPQACHGDVLVELWKAKSSE